MGSLPGTEDFSVKGKESFASKQKKYLKVLKIIAYPMLLITS